jgi:excinuclease ABC subunit B
MTPAATIDGTERFHNQQQLDAYLAGLQTEMKQAAANLDFEKAASLRDKIKRLRNPELGLPVPARRA